MRAIGLMSGTSMDGVDVALLDTDGDTITTFGPSSYRPYTDAERDLLRRALEDAVGIADRDARQDALAEAEQMVTQAHIEAIRAFLHANGMAPADIDIIGFHGQTVLHRPEQQLTIQIGDGAALAKAVGIDVVYDLRSADVAAGGQGAPLVPVYHQALVRATSLMHPVAVVNIGGVSNITYIDGDMLIACDTGPGNALLDDFMMRATGAPFDDNGKLASQGCVNREWVEDVLRHPFFTLPPPKSLDRNQFSILVLPEMSAADGAATLTAFTVAAIAAVMPSLPRPPQHWIVAGGGVHNATLMAWLSEALSPANVQTVTTQGWVSDALEAQAFAYLAARASQGLPLTYPLTTGVQSPLTGGVLAKA